MRTVMPKAKLQIEDLREFVGETLTCGGVRLKNFSRSGVARAQGRQKSLGHWHAELELMDRAV